MNGEHGEIHKGSVLAAGIGMLFGMGVLVAKIDRGFGEWLREAMIGRGFTLENSLRAGSPFALAIMLAAVVALVLAVEGTPGLGRRVMLVVTALVVATMAMPVMALWSTYWNPLALFFTLLTGGVAAIVQANYYDHRLVVVSGGDKVVPITGKQPVKPNVRRKR